MIGDILSRLDKVRKTGRNSWVACCPAHEDRSPSMTLTEKDDGHILAHCFSGCSFDDIVGAVGLGWEPWFPVDHNRLAHQDFKRPYPVADVFEAVVWEARVLSIIACDMHKKRDLSDDDYKRLWVARDRLERAWEVANGESITRR